MRFKIKRKSELYDKRPTIGFNGESWDMFIVRKMRERRIEDKNIKRYTNMSFVDVTIYYESAEKIKLRKIDRAEVDTIVEFHSKPVNGKVVDILVEDYKPQPERDLDGYYALVDDEK